METAKIKEFWNKRAEKYNTSPESTTKDFFMRKIEIKYLMQQINLHLKKQNITSIADIGCGNGYSTVELAKEFPHVNFFGYDYSDKMIESANELLKKSSVQNVSFNILDISNSSLKEKVDLIYTDRCLQNIPTWELQQVAIKNIASSLNDNGIYIFIESFIEGQAKFNELRKKFGLKKIQIPEFNNFFEKNKFEKITNEIFKTISYENISSLYFIVSRIIYSKLCEINNEEPNYYDKHHELASDLPFVGNFGPISAYQFVKLRKN